VQKDYPSNDQEFGGLYGYQGTFSEGGFLGDSNKFYVTSSELLGQNRVYITDVTTSQIKMLTLPKLNAGVDRSKGTYTLLRKFKQTLFVKYCEVTNPGSIFALTFKSVDVASLDALFDAEANLTLTEIERSVVKADPTFTHHFSTTHNNATTEILRLQNGAEALFVQPGGLSPTKTHPLITLIHGGPFSSAAWHTFSKTRSMLLMQGCCLLIMNYRGSIGYGEDTMNTLLGTVGENDVADCGDLTLLALEKY
jgi:dipeptidyl aminopeptidase/acylaminoacyl peptidase